MDQVGAFVERVVQDCGEQRGLNARFLGKAVPELCRRQTEVRAEVGHQHGLTRVLELLNCTPNYYICVCLTDGTARIFLLPPLRLVAKHAKACASNHCV